MKPETKLCLNCGSYCRWVVEGKDWLCDNCGFGMECISNNVSVRNFYHFANWDYKFLYKEVPKGCLLVVKSEEI